VTRSVVATAYGDPSVLSVIDEALRDPGPGEVLIEVRAAGTNPVDYKLYSGAFGRDPARLPMRLGFEAAGVVTAVGFDPDGRAVEGPGGPISPGDEVIAYRIDGAYADRVVVAASAVLPKPAGMSFEQASGLMLTGTTAVHALTAARVGRGDTVLVHGGAGGVGLMAVQLAVRAGADVIATASEGRHARLRELGAEPVRYGSGLVDRVRALAPDGIDAALDMVGTDEALDASVELVADRRRIATVAGFGRAPELGIQALGGGPGADPGTDIRSAARMELVHRVEAGELVVDIAAVHPLADAAAAHRELAAGHAHGKVVLVP
jgi:NADPH2:quinone reductase